MKRNYIQWFDENRHATADPSLFFAEFCELLLDEGFDLIRANVGHRALHPQVGAVSLRWSQEKNFIQLPPNAQIVRERIFRYKHGAVYSAAFGHDTYTSKGFMDSPMKVVLFDQQAVHCRIEPNATEYRFPILKDLAALGATEYYGDKLNFGAGKIGFLSLATKRAEGFSPEQLELLKSTIYPLLSSAWEHYLRTDMVSDLLRLYLGNLTGPKVLDGKILRGDMESIESVIWFSDIRGFTALSTITPRKEMVELLNSYYGMLIETITRYGGEVLKFLGDGLLVIFQAEAGKELQTKYKALLAARSANAALEKLNATRVEAGQIPIDHGIGLHFGTVDYGNIGSNSRLDFTAIGPAVNLASRIAAQCAVLNEKILLSQSLVESLRINFRSHGKIELKGLIEPEAIFALAERTRHVT